MAHFKLSKSLVDREKLILDICNGRRVLHLGCASSPNTELAISSNKFLHQKISEVSGFCLGVDIDGDSVVLLREKYGYTNVIIGNAEKLDELNCGYFDIIVAGELIEHLNNPGLFLETAKYLLNSKAKIIITTTNAFCLRRIIRIPFGYESIHPDHTFYYSHITLHNLASRFGYSLLEAHSYRITNKRPILPWLVEYMASIISPNLCEGIIHLYTL